MKTNNNYSNGNNKVLKKLRQWLRLQNAVNKFVIGNILHLPLPLFVHCQDEKEEVVVTEIISKLLNLECNEKVSYSVEWQNDNINVTAVPDLFLLCCTTPNEQGEEGGSAGLQTLTKSSFTNLGSQLPSPLKNDNDDDNVRCYYKVLTPLPNKTNAKSIEHDILSFLLGCYKFDRYKTKSKKFDDIEQQGENDDHVAKIEIGQNLGKGNKLNMLRR